MSNKYSLKVAKLHGQVYLEQTCSDWVYNEILDKGIEFKDAQFSSHNGLDRLADIVKDDYSVSKALATTYVMYNTEVEAPEWFLDKGFTEVELEGIAALSPFSSKFPTIQCLLDWKKAYTPCSIYEWAGKYSFITRNGLEGLQAYNFVKAEALRGGRLPEGINIREVEPTLEYFLEKGLLRAEKYGIYNSNPEYITEGEGLSEEFYKSLSISGIYSGETLTPEVLQNISELSSYFRSRLVLNFKYAWVDARCRYATISKLLEMGASIPTLVDLIFKDTACLHLSKKQKAGLLTQIKPLVFDVSESELFRSSDSILNVVSSLYPKTTNLSWEDCNQSLAVWVWANAHPKWVEDSKTIHGPAGRTALLHNHQLVSRMTPAMLVNGIKTSPRVIEELLEEEARREIEADLGVNVELPVLELKKALPNTIRQLTCTDELVAEGKTMNHCVGGYKQACICKESYIFHVDDGKELGATVEVSPNPWRVVQAMNYGNSRSEVAKQLVEEYVISQLKEKKA